MELEVILALFLFEWTSNGHQNANKKACLHAIKHANKPFKGFILRNLIISLRSESSV